MEFLIERKLHLLSLIVLSCTLYSCLKDDFNFNKLAKTKWNPEFALPLVTAELTLEDLFERADTAGIISVGNDGFITLIYEDQILSKSALELFDFPRVEQMITVKSPFNIPTLPVGSTDTFKDSTVFEFGLGTDNQVDSISFKNLEFILDITSTFSTDVDILIRIPSAIKAGQSYSQLIQLSPGQSINDIVSLSGYNFDLTKTSTVNAFDIFYDMTVHGNGGPVTSNDELRANITFDNAQFGKMFGIIKFSDIVPEGDTVQIEIFNSAIGQGDFSLVSPKITITIDNSFGLPIEANFVSLVGLNTISGTKSHLENESPFNMPFIVNSPDITEIGESVETTLEVDGNVIIDFIKEQPKYFVYDVNVTTIGNTAGNLFVLDTSKVEVDVKAEIPMHGTATGFGLEDTINFSLGDNITELERMKLVSRISNGFPLDLFIQLYLAEEDDFGNFIVTDSLFPSGDALLMQAAPVGVDDRVSARSEHDFEINLTPSVLESMLTANKIIISASVATLNNGADNVKFFSDYGLGVKIGAVAKVETTF